MSRLTIPFPTAGYQGPEYFCDRIKETQTLVNNLKGGISTVLVSIRRMGKTGLIHHVQQQLSKEWIPVYLDILFTRNFPEFLNTFASGILSAFPENNPIGEKLWTFIKSLRPSISFDNLTGAPQVQLDYKNQKAENSIISIFQMLEKQPKPVVIAIDEFQQIPDYPEKKTDAWLRSVIQQLRNVFFIFSGSQQHVMTHLFGHPSNPFFRSTAFLKLGKIPHNEYQNFIIKTFDKHGRYIPPTIADEILNWTQSHTYYVQLLCTRIFISGITKINGTVWKKEAEKLLIEQEMIFNNYRESLTQSQWKLLKAIAAEGILYAPTANSFISRYELESSSAVLRSLKSLLKKALVYYDFDENGNKFYQVYDLFYQRWIQKRL